MSKYNILPYSFNKAEELGVQIKPSTNPKKKIDVFKNNVKLCSIGAFGYMDYPHYLKEDKEVAQQHRARYKLRHSKDRSKVGSPGWYAHADKILW